MRPSKWMPRQQLAGSKHLMLVSRFSCSPWCSLCDCISENPGLHALILPFCSSCCQSCGQEPVARAPLFHAMTAFGGNWLWDDKAKAGLEAQGEREKEEERNRESANKFAPTMDGKSMWVCVHPWFRVSVFGKDIKSLTIAFSLHQQ